MARFNGTVRAGPGSDRPHHDDADLSFAAANRALLDLRGSALKDAAIPAHSYPTARFRA
jgi:hypothetical protein